MNRSVVSMDCILGMLLGIAGMFTSACQGNQPAPHHQPPTIDEGIKVCEGFKIPPSPAPDEAELLSFADTLTLTNEHVRLGIAPSVGRVVDFGLLGGDNLLWIAPASAADEPFVGANGVAYVNIGGDKLWPTSQKLWPAATGTAGDWPPDGVIDGSPWTLLERGDNSITIQSPLSPPYGVQVTRRFELQPDQPVVRITNTLRRVSANPFPVCAWTVTQVKMPRAALLDIAGDRPEVSEPYVALTATTPAKTAGLLETLGEDGAVLWTQTGDADAKLGSLGRWVGAVYDDVTFLQGTEYDPAGNYLDNSSAQLYRGDPYLELELLSPLATLRPGEELTNTVVWELIPGSAEEGVPAALFRDPDAEH